MKAYHCYMKDDPDAGECIVFAGKPSEAKMLCFALSGRLSAFQPHFPKTLQYWGL